MYCNLNLFHVTSRHKVNFKLDPQKARFLTYMVDSVINCFFFFMSNFQLEVFCRCFRKCSSILTTPIPEDSKSWSRSSLECQIPCLKACGNVGCLLSSLCRSQLSKTRGIGSHRSKWQTSYVLLGMFNNSCWEKKDFYDSERFRMW